ncbi:MAG: phytanoyl-CoA dioxygenase family protein [Pseudomonadales bacterium]
MPYSLSPEELTQYQRDGFLVRPSVFSESELVELCDATEIAVAKALHLAEEGKTYVLDGKHFVDTGYMTVQFEHRPGSETARVIEPANQLEPRLNALIDDPRIVEPMLDIVGSEGLSLWTAKLNLKRPREGSGFGWHQDSPYWIHDCNHVDLLPNVMLAFDDATEANGCFRVIRGSHIHGCLPGSTDGSQLGGFFTDSNSFDESLQVPLVVPAGSLIFFNPHTVHGSLPNDSDFARRAIIVTYQPADFPTLKSREVRNIQLGS